MKIDACERGFLLTRRFRTSETHRKKLWTAGQPSMGPQAASGASRRLPVRLLQQAPGQV